MIITQDGTIIIDGASAAYSERLAKFVAVRESSFGCSSRDSGGRMDSRPAAGSFNLDACFKMGEGVHAAR